MACGLYRISRRYWEYGQSVSASSFHMLQYLYIYSKEHYEQATEIVNGDTSIFESRKITSKLERRVMLNRMIADAAYVMSLLCFELV